MAPSGSSSPGNFSCFDDVIDRSLIGEDIQLAGGVLAEGEDPADVAHAPLARLGDLAAVELEAAHPAVAVVGEEVVAHDRGDGAAAIDIAARDRAPLIVVVGVDGKRQPRLV